MTEVGRVRAIYRYPVKSMAGEAMSSAELGWHGLEGDRRFAFVRSGVRGGMPWLTASKLASLVTYVPLLPSRVRTPKGEELELFGDELRAEITAAHGAPVELMHLRNGTFDDAPLSIITTSAIATVTREAGVDADARRFRPNLLIETPDGEPFPEDAWVGQRLRIGEGEEAPAVSVCTRDVRCAMLNLHPETGAADPRLMKAAVRLNDNCTGVYATIVRTGTVRVGDGLYLG
jgi:MOSC domain-containing protein